MNVGTFWSRREGHEVGIFFVDRRELRHTRQWRRWGEARHLTQERRHWEIQTREKCNRVGILTRRLDRMRRRGVLMLGVAVVGGETGTRTSATSSTVSKIEPDVGGVTPNDYKHIMTIFLRSLAKKLICFIWWETNRATATGATSLRTKRRRTSAAHRQSRHHRGGCQHFRISCVIVCDVSVVDRRTGSTRSASWHVFAERSALTRFAWRCLLGALLLWGSRSATPWPWP